MVAQIWRGMTRAADREGCVARLLAAIHTALEESATCKGAYLLTRPTGDDQVELMVLILFGGAAVATCHEPETLCRAAAVFDRALAVTSERSVAIYEVATDPRRTLSYANLRRRFPLRLMTPR